MLAIGMVRGKQGVSAFEVPEPQLSQPDEVLVRVKEMGMDGTDFKSNDLRGQGLSAPP